VKMIYIDPPYNTGKDFVYPDNFQDGIKNYLELTGQIEGGQKMEANTDSSGRFHTDWLNMMYPRLKIAHSLLKDEGTIFISCDEHEVSTLKILCNEIFGEENFVSQIVVLCNPKGRSQDKYFATNHEYILAYSKTIRPNGWYTIQKDQQQVENEYPYEDEYGKFRLLELRNTHREFGRYNRKNLFFPLWININGSVSLEEQEGCVKALPIWDDGYEGCWTWDKRKVEKDINFLFGKNVQNTWRVYRKNYANGAEKMLKTILNEKLYYTERGQEEFNTLLKTKDKIFQAPKSPFLIGALVSLVSVNEDIVLDFFAGSGTTGHAVMAQNATDGGNRRYILVQLPEPLDPDNKDQKTAADYCKKLGKPPNIAELTKERLRRAGKKIAEENPLFQGDLGFRVFKLDSSNIRTWDLNPSDLETALLDSVDHIKSDRSERDILYELLLKLGLDLAVPIETRKIGGKDVHAIGAGTLFVCLSEAIRRDDAEALAFGIAAWRKKLNPAGEVVCVFRDSGFEDNVAKTNLMALLSQNDIGNVRSL
jgi:adenine-specific DNA-methyltransferase